MDRKTKCTEFMFHGKPRGIQQQFEPGLVAVRSKVQQFLGYFPFGCLFN